MTEGKRGDHLVVESERVGHPDREGEILDVVVAAGGVHYRVRWAEGHESTFYPSGGSVRILAAAKKERGHAK